MTDEDRGRHSFIHRYQLLHCLERSYLLQWKASSLCTISPFNWWVSMTFLIAVSFYERMFVCVLSEEIGGLVCC